MELTQSCLLPPCMRFRLDPAFQPAVVSSSVPLTEIPEQGCRKCLLDSTKLTLSGHWRCIEGLYGSLPSMKGNVLVASLQVHITKPTWSNHHNIFRDAGVEKKEYRYYKPSTKGLDFEGLIDDLKVCSTKMVLPLGFCHSLVHHHRKFSGTTWYQMHTCGPAKRMWVTLRSVASGGSNAFCFC